MSESGMVQIADVATLRALAGGTPFVSGWIEVGEPQVLDFAEATGDHQWIHVDAERARRESPFGGPVAHGFLTLSLMPTLLAQTVKIHQRMGVNYGLNRVRFTSPVPVGSKVRARFGVKEAEDAADGSVQVTWNATIECEGSERPACVAEFITRHYF